MKTRIEFPASVAKQEPVGLAKTRGFFLTQRGGFFGVLLGFIVFLGFIGFFQFSSN
jgi:hypothetical protein